MKMETTSSSEVNAGISLSANEDLIKVKPEEKGLVSNDKVIKDELGKLTDSACESLNESEESGSKYQENIIAAIDSDEKDSMGCEDDDELSESQEEADEDQDSVENTFNVNNTPENSESQEVSELTNEEEEDSIEENELEDSQRETEGENSLEQNGSTSQNSFEDDNDSLSEDHKDDETSEQAGENEVFEDSLGEDGTSKSDADSVSFSSGIVDSEKVTDNKVEKIDMQDEAAAMDTNVKVNDIKTPKKQLEEKLKSSPKLKKKFPFQNGLKSNNKNDFSIEIFESKRKPIEIESQSTEQKISDCSNPINKTEDEITSEQKVTDNILTNKNVHPPPSEIANLDSPQSSERHSSEPTGSITLETASPDSIGKSSSIFLDVSQVIKEESEESDALSPVKSLAEDGKLSFSETIPDTTSKKSSEASRQNNAASSPTENTKTPPRSPFSKTPESKSQSKNETSTTPTSEGAKKLMPMAFTVELGDSAASDSSGSGSTGKKLDITASLSQWAPKHRRNLSLSKVEENKKVEERQNREKPPLGRPRSGTVGATSLGLRKGGYHSEGYFSSDQDEDGPKKGDLKSPRSARAPPVSGSGARSLSQDSAKVTCNRKHPHKHEGRACCKERERKPSVSELTGKSYRNEKNKMGTDSKKQERRNTPTEDLDPMNDDKDDVSETGTYTIDKDSPSPEIEQSQSDIDRVFGIESEAEMTSSTAIPLSTTDPCHEEDSSWMSASEITPSLSRNSPNWIHQWAAQVAEQTKPPVEAISPRCKTALQSPKGQNTLPSLPSEETNRPRRKLPSVPSPVQRSSNVIDTSDSETLKPRYNWRDSTLSSDIMTSDTESFLRDTENIVTSLQARVNKSKGINPAFRNSSFESHESGGDSDVDTSTSYQYQDNEKLSSSLRSKLRLTGLHSKNLPNPPVAMPSPRRNNIVQEPRMLNREATYDMYPTRREEPPIQSDSSSETSEPYKEPPIRHPVEKTPPLKFNRAFSLRRARLGCDEPVAQQQQPEKKKTTRPSSAGASSSSNRNKVSLGMTKSYQSVDSPSVSSPRGVYGSPRGGVGGVSKVMSSSDNFDRTDGGRFSLRLSRAGASPIGIAKSPSKSNIRKDHSSKKSGGGQRSNSTLTSKEVDFQNWKRRKNYDPMKAAAEGRKKPGDKNKKTTPEPIDPPEEDEDRADSPLGALLRSASFHGTEGGMANAKWGRKNHSPNHQLTSEEDGPYSLDEELGPHPSPILGSPLRRSPTSPHQLCNSPARQGVSSSSKARARRPSLGINSDDIDPQYQPSTRKISIEESGSEGKRSPMNALIRSGGATGNSSSGSGRLKTKMEALDNLVISTIHSLSTKVRTTSESLLQKLKSRYDEEGDRAALLEEVLSHLTESDQSQGQNRSTSRELAGILRNLKKIQHALEVIDRVLVLGDEDYEEEDELLDDIPQDWVESASDY